MYAICLESSHQKGMGHLFRCINVAEYLGTKKEQFIFICNNDPESIKILSEKKYPYETADLENYYSNWEKTIINKYKITKWINDRLETNILHSENVKKNNVKLLTIDDLGSGAALADIHFALSPMTYNKKLDGRNIVKGIEYFILSKEIENYKRKRKKIDKILVTLGGSDTYGATIKVVEILKKMGRKATIITGPAFLHHSELQQITNGEFIIKNKVPSLIKEFYEYDLAVTGGGITAYEANASGLPCIIIANEIHEIDNALYLSDIGSSVFAGYYNSIDISVFKKHLNIKKMSCSGLYILKTTGIDKIYDKINNLCKKQ